MPPGPRSAGVVPIRWLEGEPHCLLLRCYGYWDFPKGEVDPGESALETAVREVTEETGLTDLVWRWGEGFVETPPYGPKRKVARYYLAEVPTGEVFLPVSPELGRPEHHEFRWLRLDAARGLLNDRLKAVLDWARKRLTIGSANERE